MSDLIRREDAVEAILGEPMNEARYPSWYASKIKALPSAEAVSREGYNETDGVIEIEKQSAKDVEEIKHIVIHSPNYTRYFYNESMPTSAKSEQTIRHIENNTKESDLVYRPSADTVDVVRCKDCKHFKKINPKAKSGICYKDIVASAWNDDGFCSRGERKGGDDK